MTTKRAILYARVSTDDQAEKGYSLPSQIDAMRMYASAQGFEIVAEFQDDYSGATPIEHRPEGRKAYAMLQSGDADLIIAYTIDRFVRPPEDGDEWEMPILIRGLAKLGKEIHTVRRGKLNTGFADLLIALLDARKAGEERRDICERVTRGKRAKVKSGRVLGMRVPYGYRHIRDEHGKVVTLEIDEVTARTVRLIYRWYVYGDEHGKRLSERAIAVRFSEMQIPTPSELYRGYKSRKHGRGIWNYSTIGVILKSGVYVGIWRYGLYIGSTRKKRPLEETMTVTIPAIIDRETWERAQTQRAKNKEFSPRNKKHDYLLRSLIRCGVCGYAIAGECLNGRQYYHCTHDTVRIRKLEGQCANRKRVRIETIEADIWDEIHELFQNPDKLWNELRAVQQSADENLKPIREKLQITDDLINRFQNEANKIAASLPDVERGGATHKALKENDKQVNARLDELAKQREKIVKEIQGGRVTDERIETIMTIARKVKRGMERANYHGKRRLLEALDVRVTITLGKYHLKCIVGEKDGIISRMKRGYGRVAPSSYR